MSAININKNNFQNEVLNSDKPVLLDFWASWCAPCRMVVPIVEEIADERRDIKVGKINVDEETELANKFSIMSIPTSVSYTHLSFKFRVVKLFLTSIFLPFGQEASLALRARSIPIYLCHYTIRVSTRS